MRNVGLAICVWLFAGFFVWFAYDCIRSGYMVGRGGTRVERRRNPFNFWSGVVLLFVFFASLLVLGAIVLFGHIRF